MPKLSPSAKASASFPWVWLRVLLGVGVLAIALTVGGFTFAATQESHDPFCASCHTQPESTFYQRSINAQATDLASAHTAHDTRCIDCHSGEGLAGRVQAELLGAHNALAFYTGTAVQPAKLTTPFGDTNCLKCHADVTASDSMDNHFHFFLPRWQASDTKAARCVSCHEGHAADGDPGLKFLNEGRARQVCEACHRFAGEGG